jgi:hypothetical protein
MLLESEQNESTILSVAGSTDHRQHGTAQVPFDDPNNLPFEDVIATRPIDVERDERQSAIQQAKHWYGCLAQASNIIFQIEHARRRLSQRT